MKHLTKNQGAVRPEASCGRGCGRCRLECGDSSRHFAPARRRQPPHRAPAATVHAAAWAPLIMESSPESAITQTFNPYVQIRARIIGMGVDLAHLRAADGFQPRQPVEAAVFYLLSRDGVQVGGPGRQVDHFHDPGRESSSTTARR